MFFSDSGAFFMSHSAFSAGIEEKADGTGQEVRIAARPMSDLRAMKMKRGLFLLATLLLVNANAFSQDPSRPSAFQSGRLPGTGKTIRRADAFVAGLHDH